MIRLGAEQYLAVGCILYIALAQAVAPREYFAFLIQYMLMPGWALPLLLLVAFAALAIVDNPRAPLSSMRETLRGTIVAGASASLLFLFGVAAFTTLKFEIPESVPFYADPWLADLDHAIHAGEPWLLAHAHAPSWTPAVIEALYTQAWFTEWFGVFFFVAFWSNRPARARYLWAFSLTLLIVGTMLATLLSSVGPILYDRIYGGDRFAGLLETLAANGNNSFLEYANYLLAAHDQRQAAFGTGISAMPSVHVAMAVLNAWFLTSLNRGVGVIGWAFAAAILFGSVYSGWHYAIDGYVSAAITSTIWLACGRMAYASSAAGVAVAAASVDPEKASPRSGRLTGEPAPDPPTLPCPSPARAARQ